MKKIFSYDWISTVIFNITILLFIIGFGFTDTPTPFGWYQQFMPSIGNRQISDVFFLDSLNGWAVTNIINQNPDTSYVIRTSNGGDNWAIIYRVIFGGGGVYGLNRVQFLNQNTGFICGVDANPLSGLIKTTDGGLNWIPLNNPNAGNYLGMSILNTDTMWLVCTNPLTGGVFFTSNGGVSWGQQAAFGNSNPAHIYMYNARLGFIDAGGLRRTTDGGTTWTPITGAGNFLDMHFVDSLTGWKCNQDMKKTTDGGLTWLSQILPSGGNIVLNYIVRFSNVNRDTIWGVGGTVFYTGTGNRGMIFRTTNSGINWLFQIPDTASINIGLYNYSKFINRLNGWAYSGGPGVHTVSGGNDTNYTGLKQISYNVPGNYNLFQNYPNPFNPNTVIGYRLKVAGFVKLKIFDISGKYIKDIVNQRQNSGEYEVTFYGSNLSSGIYFYSLFVDGNLIDTRKMILLK